MRLETLLKPMVLKESQISQDPSGAYTFHSEVQEMKDLSKRRE
jgi:hypothetical protein